VARKQAFVSLLRGRSLTRTGAPKNSYWRNPAVDLGTCGSIFIVIIAIDWLLKCERSAGPIVTERFERHRQPWTSEELQKLKLLAGKGMALKAIAKAMTRSEESIKDRAKLDGIGIAKLR